MKKTLVLVLAASVVMAMLSGCAGKGEYYSPEESLTFGVDAASVALDTNALDVTMTHHGTLKEGIDGWTFQVYIDADHDAATGVNGADYFINGFEGRSAGGYAIRKAMPNHTWGGVIGYAGSDDGTTLTVPVSLSVVPMSAGVVRLAVYAQHKLVHDQTFDVN